MESKQMNGARARRLTLRSWTHAAFILGVTWLALCVAGAASAASMIDFETVPGTTPADKLAIDSQYAASTGATFSVDRNGDGLVDGSDSALGSIVPFLEAMGADADGTEGYVYNAGGVYDQEAPAFAGQNGNYYLRFDQTFGNVVSPELALIITFDQAMAGVGGEIWDIEPNSRNEFWAVSIYGASFLSSGNAATPIDMVEIDSTVEYDGSAWSWNFAAQDIWAVEIRFTGKADLTGVGFDNFSVVVPEPSTAVLLGLGLVWLGVRPRSERRA